MTSPNRIKLTLAALALGFSFISNSAFAGFSVSGTQLLDGNGQPFLMRGINHAHTWYTGETNSAIPNIAATGANTVRVVLSNGQTWQKNSASEITNIINLCKQNKLICMFEVHDVTGVGDADNNSSNTGTISGAADYWVEMASVFQGEEDYTLINIANEPVGNGVPAGTWITEHQEAIKKIRAAGLEHTLVVDAANWGQDWEEIMLNNASEVASADALNNTIFSVHMYQLYQDYNKINGYVSGFLNTHNLPLIVGEFGDNHQGEAVDADSIMEVAEQLGIGYLGWSWSGNGECCVDLDITINFDPNNLSPWGQRLINSPNGIKATAKLASVYNESAPVESSSSEESSASSSVSVSSESSSSSEVVSSSEVISSPSSVSSSSESSENQSSSASSESTSSGGSFSLGLLSLLGSLIFVSRRRQLGRRF